MPRVAPAVRSALLAVAGCIILAAGPAFAAPPCPGSHDQRVKALKPSVKPSGGPGSGGLDTNEWAAVVARDGSVCAIAYSGGKPEDQWPGSRAIAVEKANTANALSIDKMALSTANLYAGSQPGGFLFGLQATNPPAADLLYAGDSASFGSPNDPLVGKHPGGVGPL